MPVLEVILCKHDMLYMVYFALHLSQNKSQDWLTTFVKFAQSKSSLNSYRMYRNKDGVTLLVRDIC